jgi:di/tricarboxylate transporter/CRP-like cAMP-binding protein
VIPSDQHREEADAQEGLLRSIKFFRDLDRVDIARLIGGSEDAHFLAGAVIVREGEAADSLFLLASGEVEVSVRADGSERSVTTILAPGTFGEFGLLLAERTATVRAVTAVHAWRIPRERFERVVRERPQLGLAVARALAETIDRRDRERVGAPLLSHEGLRSIVAAPVASRSPVARIVAGAISIAVPAVLWSLPAPTGLTDAGWHIALVMLGGAVAWLLEPIPDFAVALAMAGAWGVAGLAPPTVAFSGFASSTWIVAVAALGISSAMAASGLLFRASLVLLRVFPPTHRGQLAALLLGSAVLTPLVPTVFGRIATVAPIAHELAQALGYAKRSRASASFAFAAIIGNTFLGPVFLTGVVTNFLILGLLPAGEQARFDWIGWLAAALPAGLVLLVGPAIVLMALPPETTARASGTVRHSQERTLGRISRRELVSLLALGIFVAGLLLQPVLRLDIASIGLAALLVAIGGGALDRQTFRSGIDWATLVFLGVLLGAGAVLRSGGVDHWIAELLTPITRSLGDPALTLLLLALVTVALRCVLPMVPAAFLLFLTLVPAAPQLGLSGWVVGFVTAVLAFTWLVPAQYEVLRMVREITGGEMFTDRQAVVVGVTMTAVALFAIAVSIPYWRAIGLL